MKRVLMGHKNNDVPFRTHFISEFAEGVTQTYGPFPIYDEPQNQWRMLRVLNATHNLAFIEWDQKYVFDKVDFHEYYNLTADPWQQVNLWTATSPAMQDALHAELQFMYQCKGSRIAISNCRNAFLRGQASLESTFV